MTKLDILNNYKQDIINEYNQGMGTTLLGRKYNCNKCTIRQFLLSCGVEMRKATIKDVCKINHAIIINLLNQDKSCYQISKIIGVNNGSLTKYLNKLKFDLSKHSKIRKDKLNNYTEEIIKLYNKGKSSLEIAEIYKCSGGSVIRLLNENGIQARPLQKYSYDNTYFEQIDTPNKAYVLGFMFSDGNVQLGVNTAWRLSICDLDILQDIRNEVKYTGPLYKYVRKNEKHKHVYTLQVASEKMALDLSNLGCVPNKTFKIHNLPNIPKDLMSHFVRGYFDGDGCIDTHGICSMTGHKPFLLDLAQFIGVGYKIYKYKHRNSETISIAYSKQVYAKKFCEFIYKDLEGHLYLKRKHQRYLDKYCQSVLSKGELCGLPIAS